MAASSGARHTRAAVRTHCPTTNQIQGLRQGTHSMKPQTEKPSEPVMKFFTPELFIKFNSPDDVVADRADEDWEAAIREYRSHLEGLRDQMPSQVKELAGLSAARRRASGLRTADRTVPRSVLISSHSRSGLVSPSCLSSRVMRFFLCSTSSGIESADTNR